MPQAQDLARSQPKLPRPPAARTLSAPKQDRVCASTDPRALRCPRTAKDRAIAAAIEQSDSPHCKDSPAVSVIRAAKSKVQPKTQPEF